MQQRGRHLTNALIRTAAAMAVASGIAIAFGWPATAVAADPPQPATAPDKPTAKPGAPAAVGVPYWQAPAMPTAVIQGGVIPPGWQPQAVPYQGIGPDGRPMTMYFAPTYVFTYQSGPPVLAAPTVNRRQVGVAPAATGWNYQATGAPPVPAGLPPPTVARYQPPPYQFPPNARALTGTPIEPPAGMPAPPAPQAWAVPPQASTPPPQGWAAPPVQQPMPPPPGQWVPSNVPPPPGVTPTAAAPGNTWAAVAVPAAAGGAAIAGAAVASSQPPPMDPIPYAAQPNPTPVPAQQVSSSRTAPPPAAASASNTHVWKVVAVYDGDTVTCIDENNQQQKIRLAEIDAPEAKQDFGQVSRQALAGMVFGKTIQVVDDGKDRYGRWIGHLYVDGVDVNRQMVATGMAWHYAEYSKDPSLATLQSQAQAQRIGLWSQPNPTPPSEFRKSGKKSAA